MNPSNVKYHKEHTWARIDGGKAVIGITNHAQDALGDIVFIELPEVGAAITAGQEMSEIESAKATSPVIAPVSGTVKEINTSLEDDPEVINTDPYGKGWIAVVELSEDTGADSLMDSDSYASHLEQEA